MSNKEATDRIMASLTMIGWTRERIGPTRVAKYGKRELHFRPRMIIAFPGGHSLPGAKHYVEDLASLLLDSGDA